MTLETVLQIVWPMVVAIAVLLMLIINSKKDKSACDERHAGIDREQKIRDDGVERRLASIEEKLDTYVFTNGGT